MAFYQLDSGEVNYESDLEPTGQETSNRIIGNNLNNHIEGNQYIDYISGGAGDDLIEGNGSGDVLLGNDGNDRLDGGSGNDVLNGEEGNDLLYGGFGNDKLYGGVGNDQYDFRHDNGNGGVDTINDDLSPAGVEGYGGGTDIIWFKDAALNELLAKQDGNDLKITTAVDFADDVMDSGVVIEDFFLGGNNVVEFLVDENQQAFDLTIFL